MNLMPDTDKPTINQSHDFQFGVAFARLDSIDGAVKRHVESTDKRFVEMRKDFQELTASVSCSIESLGSKFETSIQNQTEKLTPLFEQETIRKGLADLKEHRSELNTNFWMRAASIIAIVVPLFGAVQYMVQYAVKSYVHVPVQVIPINQPDKK